MNNEYRQELKYLINNNDISLIINNLRYIMKKDDNCIDDHYTISSIYFDTIDKQAYNQIKNGISRRWKYRIRFYNYSDGYIKLEKKYKENNLSKKTSVRINKNQLQDILNNKIKISKNNEPLLNEFILKIKLEKLSPVICIEYDRIPFVYKLGNVRITIDYNIRYTNKYNDLFNSKKRTYYLKDRILEIKYNQLIPEFIKYKLQLNYLEQTSFSKFKNCIDDLEERRGF